MKNSISKLVLVGAILASTLAAASAAPRHQVSASTSYAYDMGSSPDAVYNNHFDNEQARRDIGGQGG